MAIRLAAPLAVRTLEAVAIEGWLDRVGRIVSGWACDPSRPDEPLVVTVLVDGVPVARSVASLLRPDVQAAGFASDRCGFRERVPPRYQDGEPHEVRVLVGPREEELDGSPRVFVLGEPTAAPALQPFAVETVRDRHGDLDEVRRRVASSGRLALLATHRAGPGGAGLAQAHVDALHELGAAVVCVDTSEAAAHVDVGADLALERANVGWDFASWLAGVHEVRDLLDATDELILVNDSTYGPLVGLDDVFASPHVQEADAWAVTDSWDIRYHLQSYFVVLRSSALRSPALWRYFESYSFPRSKADVVLAGEVGLTSALRAGGLTIAAAHPYEAVARQWLASVARTADVLRGAGMSAAVDRLLELATAVRDRQPLNPTHVFWNTLLERAAPFLKRDLVLFNRHGVPTLSLLPEALAPFKEYDQALIVEDARAVGGTLVPLL
jgi:hypothetical protein